MGLDLSWPNSHHNRTGQDYTYSTLYVTKFITLH